MARLLLVHGASPGEKDEDGHNPEEWHLLLGRSVSRTFESVLMLASVCHGRVIKRFCPRSLCGTFSREQRACWFGLRESVARTIRMLQSPKFALDEADKCFQAGEMWLALRLCEMGLKFYSCALPAGHSLGN